MRNVLIISIIILFILGGCASQVASPSSSAAPSPPSSRLQTEQPEPTTPYTTQLPVKEVTLEMFNFGFKQDPIVIKKGDHVRLRVISSSGTHGIMIPELGLSTERLSEGKEDVLEFDATESGTFEYFCNVPCGSGHRSMKGQLVVE